MKKRTVITIIIIIALFLIAAIFMMQNSGTNNSNTGSEENSSSQLQEEPNTVNIDNFKFTVQNLTVKMGTTVTWRNMDTARHDINFADSAISDSELLGQNETYSYTFDTVGEYSYSCTPHPFMKATITVTQ